MAKTKEFKSKGLFEFINDITVAKVNWRTYTESEQKEFSVYMINRWLSMDIGLIEIINAFQKLTLGGNLEKRDIYNLYKNIIPKQKFYLKYTKSEKQDLFNPELIEYIKMYFSVGSKEAKEYLLLYFNTNEGIEQLVEVLQKYGMEEKKIKKLLTKK